MGIFSSIKKAIFGEAKAQETPAKPAATAPRPATTPFGGGRPEKMDEVDIEKNLDARPGADKLNWRSSIVDLLKLLNIDSDFAARKELAGEMGDNDYSGTAEENIWLHKQVMKKLSENGGRVPPSLLD